MAAFEKYPILQKKTQFSLRSIVLLYLLLGQLESIRILGKAKLPHRGPRYNKKEHLHHKRIQCNFPKFTGLLSAKNAGLKHEILRLAIYYYMMIKS